MAQKFNVEILVHHLRIGDEMYKKGQVVTFPADVVKRIGNSVKILIEIPETKTQRTASTPATSTPVASTASTISAAPTTSAAASTKNEEKTAQTEDKK